VRWLKASLFTGILEYLFLKACTAPFVLPSLGMRGRILTFPPAGQSFYVSEFMGFISSKTIPWRGYFSPYDSRGFVPDAAAVNGFSFNEADHSQEA